MLLDAIPILPVSSLDRALTFYRDQLGFEVRHRESGLAIVERDGVMLHLAQLDDASWRTRADFIERPIKSGAESFIPGTASCRIRIDDAEQLLAEIGTGAQLRDQWWGDRDFALLDPDGNLVTFFQRGAVPRTR